MWEQKPANAYKKGSKAQAAVVANMMSTHPEQALIYGAIILKVNYSLVRNGFKTGCYKYKTGKPVTTKDKFKEVLMAYNGDGCTTQKKYQSDILDKTYPAILGTAAH